MSKLSSSRCCHREFQTGNQATGKNIAVTVGSYLSSQMKCLRSVHTIEENTNPKLVFKEADLSIKGG